MTLVSITLIESFLLYHCLILSIVGLLTAEVKITIAGTEPLIPAALPPSRMHRLSIFYRLDHSKLLQPLCHSTLMQLGRYLPVMRLALEKMLVGGKKNLLIQVAFLYLLDIL